MLKPRCNQDQGEDGPNRDCGICNSTKNRKIPRAALEAASRVDSQSASLWARSRRGKWAAGKETAVGPILC